MRILRLQLQNLNSLCSKEPIDIDFTTDKFMQTPIFLISGVTGAGKTTILDAITLALYHRVPRLDSSNIVNIVNYGSSQALSIVEFEVDNIIYEATWSMRVRTKSGKKLKKPQENLRLKDLSRGKILAEKKKDIEKRVESILKLNYKQFLRAVLLAQGEFSAFLLASPKDKSLLLEQITGEDIYKKIGVELLKRVSAQKRLIEDVTNRLNTQDLLDESKRDELHLKKRELELKIDNLDKIQKEIDTLKSQYTLLQNNYRYINTQIIEHKREIDNINITIKNILNLDKSIESKKSLLKQKEQLLNVEENTKRSKEKELLKIQKTIESLNIDLIESKREEIIQIIDNRNRYNELLAHYSMEEKRFHKISEELKKNLKIEKSLTLQREILNQKLEDKSRIYELELKIVSLEKERDRLKFGEPCILCGSTLHPKKEEYQKIEPTHIEKEIKKIKRDIRNLDKELNPISKNIIVLKTNQNSIKDSMGKISKDINRLQDVSNINIDLYLAKREELNRRVSKFKKAQNSRDILINSIINLKLDSLRANISDIKNSISSLEKSRSRLTEYQNRHTHISRALEILDSKKSILSKEIDELRETIESKDEHSINIEKRGYIREIGRVEERFNQDKRIRERNQRVIEELNIKEERLKRLNLLLKLLGGTKDSFNIYVQRLTLIELIKLANRHLYRFAPRYRLMMYEYRSEKEALKFGIIDSYQANLLREIDTSSGGEKFIISLALALGLSDLASKSVKIKSLFIDEGFGTLDSKSLDTVISTLETLKERDKLIGIISHVDTLKERITTQIEINKMGNGISKVKIVG